MNQNELHAWLMKSTAGRVVLGLFAVVTGFVGFVVLLAHAVPEFAEFIEAMAGQK